MTTGRLGIKRTRLQRIISSLLAGLVLAILVSTIVPLRPAAASPIPQIDSVKAGLDVLERVGSALYKARSIIAEVDNNSDLNFQIVAAGHSHGGFAEPPRGVDSHAADVFGSQSKGFMTGTEGWVRYRSTKKHLYLTVQWNNPYFGSNKCTATLSGKTARRYQVVALCGSGEKKAYMRYILYKR